MLKRELNHSTTALGGPQSKKRKDDRLSSGPSSDDVQMADGTANATTNGDAGAIKCKKKVTVQGLKLWQIVKDAVNKECVWRPAFCNLKPFTHS
jgi:hypothetical protein